MASAIEIQDFEADGQGSSYADVLSETVARAALTKALAVMNAPEGLMRMKDSVDRHLNPPLVGVFRDIEALPEFVLATKLRPKAFGRLKQAIGVACKLTMARHYQYVPLDLPNSRPDQARVERYSKRFVTARRYRQS